MNAAEEREKFSRRLRAALDRAGWKVVGATALAREFNRRSPGQPVTAHATRKWLKGEAIPAQDHLQVLARWLEAPAHWLRFGETTSFDPVAVEPLKVSEAAAPPFMSERAARLAADVARLNAEQQRLIEELVGMLLEAQAPTGKH